jgi:hypothetical protein
MDILHTDDVAKMLKVNKRTIQIHAQNGVYPPNVCIKYGRIYCFNKDALLEWLFNKNTIATASVGV